MIFWDTSALVPLIVDETRSQRCAGVLEDDPKLIVWWASRVECVSAITRIERHGEAPPDQLRSTRARLEELARFWLEVGPSEIVRERAEDLLRRHPLRAADALQLAAASSWSTGRPRGHRFFSFDERLSAAAEREGFTLVDA